MAIIFMNTHIDRIILKIHSKGVPMDKSVDLQTLQTLPSVTCLHFLQANSFAIISP